MDFKGSKMLKIEDIENLIINDDCFNVLRELPNKCVDLVLTDPPYLIKNTNAGGNSKFSKSIQNMNNQIKEANLTNGVSLDFCKEIIRIQDKINAYIWCNKEQLLKSVIIVGKCFQPINVMKKEIENIDFAQKNVKVNLSHIIIHIIIGKADTLVKAQDINISNCRMENK